MTDESRVPDYLLSKRSEPGVVLETKRMERSDFVSDYIRYIICLEIDFTPNGNVVFKKGNNGLISIDAGKMIYGWIKANVNTVTTLTNYAPEQANEQARYVVNDYVKWLYLNRQALQIPSHIEKMLVSGFRVLVIAQFNGAINGQENKAISESAGKQHISYEIDDKRKPGSMPLPVKS